MATVVNLLCISKLLRIDLKHSHHKKVMWGGGCVNYFDWVIILQYMSVKSSHTYQIIALFFKFYLLILERGREREKHQFGVPLLYAFTGCFLYVPWPEVKPEALAHLDYNLTSCTQPGSPWTITLNINVFYLSIPQYSWG